MHGAVRSGEPGVNRGSPYLPEDRAGTRGEQAQSRRQNLRRISGRNQLVGRIVDVKIEGLIAQVTLSIAGQHLTSIITADAAREMRLEKGQVASALIKSTEIMVMR